MKTLKWLSVVMLVLGLCTTQVQAQPVFHGISVLKSAAGPSGLPFAHLGENVTVIIRVTNSDTAGHAIQINTIGDVVHHDAPVGDIDTGNLLGAPVLLANLGDFIDVSHTYPVHETDVTSPHIDDAYANGIDLGLSNLPVSGAAPGAVFLLHPDITIVKTVDCDGDGIFADSETTVGPDTPTWRIVVTNTGDTDLSNIQVSDTNGEVYTIASLAVGASDTHTYVGASINVTTTNTATVTAEDLTGFQVTATDSATNNIIHPSIDLEKLVNGDDADVATGPVVPVGSTVTFSFVVTNNGDVDLTNVVVTDSVLGAIGTIPSLAAGASQTLTATAPALIGQHTNTGTATGTPPVGPDVSDTDPGNYFGAAPAIDLEKLVNGDDADSPTGPVVPVGSTVTFSFVVTNTGNVALTNVVVTDDVLGSIGTIPSLAVGASATLTATAPALAGQHTNTGTATDGNVSDTDPGNYFGAAPGLDLEKFVNGDDADLPTGPIVLVGDPVTFTFVVTNTGNVPLTNVVVTDDVLGSIGTIPSLAVGASATLTATAPALAGQHTNTGTATDGNVSDTDPGNYFGGSPGLDIEKLVNGADADLPTGPVVAVGSTVTFDFVVCNTGNIALTNVVVTDDVLGTIGTIASLAVGQCQTLTATAPAVAGQHTNTACVTSDQVDGDCDPGNYLGEEPGNEGCTPGFWKNNADKQEANAWNCYSPDTLFSDVFGVTIKIFLGGNPKNDSNYITDPTLLEALGANGGGINALARHGVAALLSACSDCVNYAIADPQDVIDQVHDAILDGEDAIDALHIDLAAFNEAGCPINQQGECSHPI